MILSTVFSMVNGRDESKNRIQVKSPFLSSQLAKLFW